MITPDDDFSEIVEQSLEKNPNFLLAHSIVKQNSQPGKIYLIGGMVYRPIIDHLYHLRVKSAIDFDFLIENPIADPNQIFIPQGWDLDYTHLGSFKFIKGDSRIDYLPIDMRLQMGGLKIESLDIDTKVRNYLAIVPLSLQSIVYDIETKTILGPISIDSIKNKTVIVNNPKSCKDYLASYGNTMTILDYMKKKYSDLGFRLIS